MSTDTRYDGGMFELTPQQCLRMESSLIEIMERARQMSDQDWITCEMGTFFDDRIICREMENIVGVCTETPISLPCDLCGEEESCEHDGMNRK